MHLKILISFIADMTAKSYNGRIADACFFCKFRNGVIQKSFTVFIHIFRDLLFSLGQAHLCKSVTEADIFVHFCTSCPDLLTLYSVDIRSSVPRMKKV